MGGLCLLPEHMGLISEATFRHQQSPALPGLLLFPSSLTVIFPKAAIFLKGHNLYSFLNLFPQTIFLAFCLFQGSLKLSFFFEKEEKLPTPLALIFPLDFELLFL